MNKPYAGPYVLGFDGGGTKTKVSVGDLKGQIICSLQGGSLNINSQGEEGLKATMTELFQALQEQGFSWEQLQGLCIGVAGISNPLTRKVLLQSVQAAGIAREPILVGDHQAALYGAHEGAPGMIMIAGTGSICYGENAAGEAARAGGWGHLIDDEGSAYALGRDVLAAVVQAEDGRIPPTCMRKAVFEQIHATSIQELIQYVYSPATGKKGVAALAPIVMQGVEAEEEAAIAILQKAAEKLASLVKPVAVRLGLTAGSLALCGGVITQNEVLQNMLRSILMETLPELNVILPKQDAAAGAVLRCLK